MERIALGRQLVRSALLRRNPVARLPLAQLAFIRHTRSASSVPTVVDVSFWKSLIPKPFRRRRVDPSDPFGAPATKKPKSKEWNPATFYIVIFLLIGSMSIQMISLKKNFEAFMRQSEVRIGLLREVVEKIQKGEQVDVERVLGTGDPAREKDWEEVLREIEHDDTMSKSKKQDKRKSASSSPSDAAPNTESLQDSPKAKSVNTASFF